MKNLSRHLKTATSGVLLLSVLTFTLMPFTASAIDLSPLRDVAQQYELSTCDSFECILYQTIELLLGVLFVIAVLFLVICGYRLLTAAGNEEQITKAKGCIVWAVSGVAIALLAWIILRAVVAATQGNSGAG